jgi:hypothetical protein
MVNPQPGHAALLDMSLIHPIILDVPEHAPTPFVLVRLSPSCCLSPTYLLCAACGTLVVSEIPASDLSRVSDDDTISTDAVLVLSSGRRSGFSEHHRSCRNDLPSVAALAEDATKFKRPRPDDRTRLRAGSLSR